MVALQDSFGAAGLGRVSYTLTLGWRLLSDGNNFFCFSHLTLGEEVKARITELHTWMEAAPQTAE